MISKHFLLLSSFFLLGSSSWILANGIYAEIPLIVEAHDYTIVSKIALCVTLSNIAPFLWSLLADLRNGKTVTKTAIAATLVLGLATSIVLTTTDAAGHEPSLLAASTCAGIIGCMSKVLLFPHASASVSRTTAMAAGMAVASLFVALLAIHQMSSGTNTSDSDSKTTTIERYSIQVYFGIVTGVFALSVVGFIGTLHLESMVVIVEEVHPIEVLVVDKENVSIKEDLGNGTTSYKIGHTASQRPSENTLLPRQQDDMEGQVELSVNEPNPSGHHDSDDERMVFHWTSFWSGTRSHCHENAAQFCINGMDFILPGIVPFSVQHFPNASEALHYLVVAMLMAQTCGIVLSAVWQCQRIWIHVAVFCVFWIPTVILSIVNDTTFHTLPANSAVPIVLNAVCNFLFGYSSTALFHMVEHNNDDDNDSDDNGLPKQSSQVVARVMGTWSQVGAMVGGLIAFFLVQYKAIQ